MSRVGKSIIKVPASVKITVNGQKITAEGPKGKLDHLVHPLIKFKVENSEITLIRPDEEAKTKSLHGTNRALVHNIVHGVSEGFKKDLEIIGVGYRAEKKGTAVNLLLGYSHPIIVEPPKGITINIDGNTKLSVTGIDKQVVGQVAANIRAYRQPEPYKGKGIRYSDEVVRRKEVKKS